MPEYRELHDQIFFTGDQHFDHKNIIKYCNRPFNTVEEMNETIIAKFNSVVNEEDTIYHLGDFCLSKQLSRIKNFLSQLHGKHHLILGNHDRLFPFEYIKAGFITVHTRLEIKLSDNSKALLEHDPASASTTNSIFFNTVLLHAHIHGLHRVSLETNTFRMNVGVDANNFYPVSMQEIIRLKTIQTALQLSE